MSKQDNNKIVYKIDDGRLEMKEKSTGDVLVVLRVREEVISFSIPKDFRERLAAVFDLAAITLRVWASREE